MARYTKVNAAELVAAGTPDLTGPLACEHMALRAARIAPGGSATAARAGAGVAEEVHFLAAGRGRIEAGEERFDVGPLDAVRVPAGMVATCSNIGDDDCWWIVMAAPTDGAPGRAGSDRPSRLGWDDLADGTKLAPPPGYRHPWPTERGYVSRDYTDAIGCTHLSFVVNRMEPGTAGQHHRHVEAEELHYLLEGTCEMRVGDELLEARAHDVISVPPDEYRSFHDPGPEPCRWLVVGAPITEFIEEDLGRYLAANDWSAADAPR